MEDTEKQLVDKAKDGDRQAFEVLVSNYQKKVFNIALRMMGNYEDANDLSQEAFIRMYRSLSSFKEQSSFSTWMYRVTTNVCLDELRKRKNKKIISLDDDIKSEEGFLPRQIESPDAGPEEIAQKNELSKLVSEAINLLSEEHKSVLILRDMQSMSYEEISAILKLPEGTVKSRINRARSALRDILKSKRELLFRDYVK